MKQARPKLGGVKPRGLLRDLLRNAVEVRLVADVPVGAFLSGGVDSTAVVALQSQLGSGPPRTFTAVFDEPGFDDAAYARLVANRLQTDHTEVLLTDRELLEQVPEALAAQDHPSADGVNTYLMARAARKAGLVVCLSGLGGDELFGGYPSFPRLRRLARAAPVLRTLPRTVRESAGRLLGSVRPTVAASKLVDLLTTDGSVAEVYPVLRRLYSRDQASRLLAPETVDDGEGAQPYTPSLREALARHSPGSVLRATSYAECTAYLHDVLLRDTDQMSMANSLEVRVPFLDREVVEYVMSLSDEVRRPSRPPKRFLAEALGDLLPAEVAARPKSGFTMPFGRWMRGPLQALGEGGIEVVADHPAFHGQAVRDTWQAFLREDGQLSWSRLWLLVALGRWLDREGVR